MGAVAVLGSINIDQSLLVERLPAAGQTIHALGVSTGLGGKGANQAMAAALSGADVAFFGAVGDDAAGRGCLDRLAAAGVSTDAIRIVAGTATGQARITVDRAGANHIIVVAGANHQFEAGQTQQLLAALTAGTPVLLQGEVPLEVNRLALAACAELGLRAIVNLAPFEAGLAGLVGQSWCLLVNESEAAALLGEHDHEVFLAPGGWVDRLDAIAQRWIVTLGAAGAWVGEPEQEPVFIDPVPCPNPIDSTGAGDAFAGALAAGLAAGLDLASAARVGARAGSAVCGFRGASESFAQAIVPISALPARPTVAGLVRWALTGEDATADPATDPAEIAGWLRVSGWDAARLIGFRDVRWAAGLGWPLHIPAEDRGEVGAAQLHTITRAVLDEIGVAPTPRLRDRSTPLSQHDRALLADRPPHHGSVG